MSKFQNGFTIYDIEEALFFILLIRFIILAFKYNLKTSFYMICISLVAGGLWYQHLTEITLTYGKILFQVPWLFKFGRESLALAKQVHWYNIGSVFSDAFKNGIISRNLETQMQYYIDPISMIVSKLPKGQQDKILPFYYELYQNIIPNVINILRQFWNQFFGLASYIFITRIGKRYCPYLIRWHWTFVIIFRIFEQLIISLVQRIYYFKTFVLSPQEDLMKLISTENSNNLLFQIKFLFLKMDLLPVLMHLIISFHIGFLIFALFHAISGQYFYFPFFVENTELHIGRRPTNSIYSMGKTAWQNPEEKEKNKQKLFKKVWYGWFGRGTNSTENFWSQLQRIFKRVFRLRKG